MEYVLNLSDREFDMLRLVFQFASAVLVFIGLLIAAWNLAIASKRFKKDKTKESSDYARELRSEFRSLQINLRDIDPKELLHIDNEKLPDVMFYLNSYERLAIDLKNGYLIEDYMRASMGFSVIYTWKKTEHLIYELRSKGGNARYFEHFEKLYQRWETQP
ncbi:hypothetical protein BFV94_4896 [Alteromonas macleodii]|uniref:DUF4760 domain-containing protein n=2 Tax=Alteromonas macleodii TaxID=28108 RepID=A0AB36FL99_ALTMA|nr:hypothetical protein BFV93_4924 [Alteromonas macleodii]OES23946.1 hypothetical protein BFV94_4896 [Alteromonas macleodii]OES25646.1 hypothetical protein BFV95_4328 [Alteromonas macleodii]OES38942.1 hypothetical protein BFV96_4540 [Alteromonas macleodii]